MNEVKWIKFNVDMFDDEKIKIISAMPEGDALIIVWVRLLTLAGKTNNGGYIYISDTMPYTDETLSIVMNKPLNIIRLALDTFSKLGMIENDNKGIYLVNFEKHQSLEKLEKIRQQTKERVARFRERKKQEMLCNVTSNDNVTECNGIDKDKEIDKDNISSSINNICNYIEENFGRMISSVEVREVQKWLSNNTEEIIKYAVDISILNNVKTIKYINGILENWKNKGYVTLEEIKKNDVKVSERNEELEQELEDLKDYNWFDEE